jgi:hypothetical protein
MFVIYFFLFFGIFPGSISVFQDLLPFLLVPVPDDTEQ